MEETNNHVVAHIDKLWKMFYGIHVAMYSQPQRDLSTQIHAEFVRIKKLAEESASATCTKEKRASEALQQARDSLNNIINERLTNVSDSTSVELRKIHSVLHTVMMDLRPKQ